MYYLYGKNYKTVFYHLTVGKYCNKPYIENPTRIANSTSLKVVNECLNSDLQEQDTNGEEQVVIMIAEGLT